MRACSWGTRMISTWGRTYSAYYERLAKGGVGLLIVEAATVDYPWGARHRNRYRLDDDKYIEGWKELAEVIHRHGCPTFMQVNHDGPWQVHWGRETNPVYAGPPVAASPVYLPNPNDHHNEMPRALTIPEIEGIVEKFAKAAVRAKKAGFDGIDINAGSSHLFHNFFSPFWNKREDVYGGSVENRARLLVQVLREMKRLVGKDFPVSVVINGIEMREGNRHRRQHVPDARGQPRHRQAGRRGRGRCHSGEEPLAGVARGRVPPGCPLLP